MFTPYEFYRSFMVDFFLYKQATYKNIVDNYEEIEPLILKNVFDYKKDDYLNAMRSSIRVTYFHCIETLFEIIFAIEHGIRKINNEGQDEIILERLATSDFRKNFERISKIGMSDPAELEKFEENIFLPTVGHEISLLRYIFYYVMSYNKVSIDKEWWDKLDPSLNAIKLALITLAKDFTDRTEYNSYKHGLRVLPLSRKFDAWETGTNKQILSLDFSNSMTFLSQSKEEFAIITKAFDTQRDYNMTVVASELLAQIINIRKGFYFNKSNEQTIIKFFDSGQINGLAVQNVAARELKFTWKRNANDRAS